MSKIEELMQKLCPNGVEYKKFKDIGWFFGGLSGKRKEDFLDGNAKFITYMNVYSNPSINLNIEDTVRINEGEKQNTIAYGDILFTTSSETPDECGMSSVVTEYPQENFYLNSFCFGFRMNDLSLCNVDFLKHLLRSNLMRKTICRCASGVTRFNVSKKKMEEIEIPVPPIEVQQEIVRILDRFSTLSEKLNRELEIRKKQYEYYREKMLSFEGKDVEWFKLEDVFEMRNGYTPSKANKAFWENGTIPWFRMEDIRLNGNILSESIQHITKEAVKGGRLFPANSFILATTATIGEHALLIVDSLANQQFTNLKVRKSLIDKLLIKFLHYYMFVVDEWCKKNVNVSGFASVDMTKFKKVTIPIPPLAEQERIVSILDKFDTLVNDQEKGLPAEIRKVQQQYEYYRDKLLTF